MWYDRDILGLWTKAEGLIYLDFDREKHVITWDELPKDDKGNLALKNFFAGQDWGYNHPGVLGLYAFDILGTCYRLLEIAERQKGPEWWRTQVLGLYKIYGDFPVYCPHDRPDLKNDYSDAGIIAENADTTPGSVKAGIYWCAEQYKIENAFKIVGEKNENFLKEIRGYRWSDKLSKEEPIKEMDDSMDSDRYARYTHIAHLNVANIIMYDEVNDGMPGMV